MNDIGAPTRDLQLFAGLYEHQRTELARLLNTTGHRLIYWQQGTGKTPLVARLGWAIGAGPKLYLCPASLKTQVARELVRWGGPNTRVQILEGRRAQLDADVDWAVCNYDLLLSKAIFAQMIAKTWRLLIVDEAHVLRNLTARRTQLVLGRKPCLADQANRVVCLTGTPVVNSPADLFPMLNRLLPRAIAVADESGVLRRRQFSAFRAHFCTFRTVHIAGGKILQVPAGAQNVEELRSKLAPHMSR